MSKPLTIICTSCAGEGSIFISRYGGNDPDVWDAGPCELCDATGHTFLCCDCCPNPEATEWFQSLALCATCAAEQKADALSMAEDRP
jgi:hypothetical protein